MLEDLNSYCSQVQLSIASLSVYRKLHRDKVMEAVSRLAWFVALQEKEISSFTNLYNDVYFQLISAGYNGIQQYIIDLILYTDTPFSTRICHRQTHLINPELKRALGNDLSCLQHIGSLNLQLFKQYALDRLCTSSLERTTIDNLPVWGGWTDASEDMQRVFYQTKDWRQCVQPLISFFQANGSGPFARYKGFVWETNDGKGELRGIPSPDPITFDELIGYEHQRSVVIDNTLQFLEGHRGNNILLYGDRGTGKSSTVKALLNQYQSKGLRLVELPKASLTDFPQLVRRLRPIGLCFIVFIDDLAFEDSEESYTALKAVLEGGIEDRPDNVVIYATSNRRHLIKEKFSDREGLQSINRDDQVRAGDTLQEKLSLSDRFGITVIFSTPDQDNYLTIVEGLAQKKGLHIDRDQLLQEAKKWAQWYNGPSPRTARQFVDWLSGQLTTRD